MSNKKYTYQLYGRRLGRPLTNERQLALDTLLPKIGIEHSILKCDGQLNPTHLFDWDPKTIWLEIGFGNGEHLNTMMKLYPEHAYIGAEPFVNGMSYFLKAIQKSHNRNIRVLMDDAILLADSFTNNSLDKIFILNPDPWPKTRHHKRRIINQDNLDSFARILKPTGQIIMSTDVPDLAEWMVTQTMMHSAFKWQVKSCHDWKQAPSDWIQTRYEMKKSKGSKAMSYLIFSKNV